MKPKFNLDNYKYSDKVVMNCKTENEAKMFCEFLHENDLKWCGGGLYNSATHWNPHQSETCYNWQRGMYGTMWLYEQDGYTILSFDDFNWEEDKDMNEVLYRARCVNNNGLRFYVQGKIYEITKEYGLIDEDGCCTFSPSKIPDIDILNIESKAVWELVEDDTKEETQVQEVANKTKLERFYEILGVEEMEEFYINDGTICKYRFVKGSLGRYEEMYDLWANISDWTKLLKEDVIITKIKPIWKPKDSERYYFIRSNGRIDCYEYESNNTIDMMFYKIGNCFKTKEEITQDIIDKYVTWYESDEVMEI